MQILKGKTIVIGVTGGIAAYKAVDVVSRLKKLDANVRVAMTANACEFVAPLTFQSMSQNPVATEMFAPVKYNIEHISLADEADVYAIIPATANVIGKIASGLADDILTTSVMATAGMGKPILIAPAMNTNMYQNPIVIENVEKLRTLGYHVMEAESGRLACGIVGNGKLAKVDNIVDKIIKLATLGNTTDAPEVGAEASDIKVGAEASDIKHGAEAENLKGKTILITAGATVEDVDPVRFITNRSTGKMGYAIARAAKTRGANVILIAGNTNLSDIPDVETVKVRSAQDMYNEVMKHAETADIIVKAAAVGDYRAVDINSEKIKKSDNDITIKLTKNPDILQELGEKYSGKKIIVGFCMETENLLENAKEKLTKKKADIIVANNLNVDGAGFASDTNVVTMVEKNGNITELPKMAKDELAFKILDKIAEGLTKNERERTATT